MKELFQSDLQGTYRLEQYRSFVGRAGKRTDIQPSASEENTRQGRSCPDKLSVYELPWKGRHLEVIWPEGQVPGRGKSPQRQNSQQLQTPIKSDFNPTPGHERHQQ